MITKNSMQLKAFVKKKAEEKHISAQLVMQNYMMERLLERLSLSPYKRNFILKGGFLIAAIVGLDSRATMDLDTTVKGFSLTHDAMRKIFEEVCAVSIEDDIHFSVIRTTDIREGDDYPGLRVSLTARDFYDIHILYALRGADCDRAVLRQALEETAKKRGSQSNDIVANIRTSPQMRRFWERYQKEFDYAKGISFDDTCHSILLILNELSGV